MSVNRISLHGFGAEPVAARCVQEGKVMTAAGVSAGIDTALTLMALEYGDSAAQAIQLGIEYDPQPPFDAGSPTKAPKAIIEHRDPKHRSREGNKILHRTRATTGQAGELNVKPKETLLESLSRNWNPAYGV